MPQFRKRSEVVTAEQFTGMPLENMDGIMIVNGPDFRGGIAADIHTIFGVMRAEVGDWVLRNERGACFPCKQDRFADTYEPVA